MCIFLEKIFRLFRKVPNNNNHKFQAHLCMTTDTATLRIYVDNRWHLTFCKHSICIDSFAMIFLKKRLSKRRKYFEFAECTRRIEWCRLSFLLDHLENPFRVDTNCMKSIYSVQMFRKSFIFPFNFLAAEGKQLHFLSFILENESLLSI